MKNFDGSRVRNEYLKLNNSKIFLDNLKCIYKNCYNKYYKLHLEINKIR